MQLCLPVMRIGLAAAFALLPACREGTAGPEPLPDSEIPISRDLRVGSLDGPDGLTAFSQLLVGPAGEIFIGQPQDGRILVFSPGGERLREIGRRGAGPGEFQRIVGMGLVGDTLWVYDLTDYRFTYFATNGDYRGSESIPRRSGGDAQGTVPMPWGLLHDGTVYGTPPVASHLVAADSITESPIVRMTKSGEGLDTIIVNSLVNTQWTIGDPANPMGGGLYTRQPFSDTELIRISPFGAEIIQVDRRVPANAEAGLLQITKRTFADDTIYSRRFSYRATPIQRAEVDSLVDAISGGAARGPASRFGTPAQLRDWAAQDLYNPGFHPVVHGVLFGRDGTLWLERRQPFSEQSEWIGLSSSGDPLGVVRPEARFTLLAADREHLWGMERDDLDVPYLVRYRMDPSE